MLTSLKIKNFRMLEDFEVKTLGRINLIVGKNNSGKSTVLEALRIFAGNANPPLLEQIALGHDEKTKISREEALDDSSPAPFQDLFTGRIFPEQENSSIYIGDINAETKNYVNISHIHYTEEKEEVKISKTETIIRKKRSVISKAKAKSSSDGILSQALRVTIGKLGKSHDIDFEESGVLTLTLPLRSMGGYLEGLEAIPASYIPTQFISIDDLADIWDDILFSDYSTFVKQGLTIMSDDFEDIAFVKRDENPLSIRQKLQLGLQLGSDLKRECKIKLKGINRAVPLNSLGDGMLRVLQLMLKIYPAKGGFLLIDEFENGLHYSVQEKIWALLFDLAEKLDIQVFATTHSWDCIESFAKVATERKNTEGVLFRVGRSVLKSDKCKVISTVFDKAKLAKLTQADVEVR